MDSRFSWDLVSLDRRGHGCGCEAVEFAVMCWSLEDFVGLFCSFQSHAIHFAGMLLYMVGTCFGPMSFNKPFSIYTDLDNYMGIFAYKESTTMRITVCSMFCIKKHNNSRIHTQISAPAVCFPIPFIAKDFTQPTGLVATWSFEDPAVGFRTNQMVPIKKVRWKMSQMSMEYHFDGYRFWCYPIKTRFCFILLSMESWRVAGILERDVGDPWIDGSLWSPSGV